MRAQVFTLPDLGEGLTEAEIVEWLVGDGDQVQVDQPVVVVETAKASVEVPCPYAGRVAARHGGTGDTLQVGEPLLTVGGDAEGLGDERPDSSGSDSEASGAVLIGYGTNTAPTRRARRAQRGRPAGHRPQSRPRLDVPAGDHGVRNSDRAPRVISPVVRTLIARHGLRTQDITPTFGDVIRRADVEAALASQGAHATQAAQPTHAAPGANPDTDAAAYDERVPMTAVRRAIADKLRQSRREIPDATTWVDVDATGLVETRRMFKSSGRTKVTLLALLARFCIAGLQRFPDLNASVEGDDLVRHTRINLGFAADSPRGLVVPVVRDAGRMTTAELAERLAALTTKAREGTLTPTELTGGTFTLNNYGVFGVDGSTPIINHPEAAMLGIGRIIDRPWVVEGQLAVRKVTQLGFTFDHRVCDGGVAGGFLRYIADLVEQPALLLDSV